MRQRSCALARYGAAASVPSPRREVSHRTVVTQHIIAAQLRPRDSADRGPPSANRADQRSQAPAMLAWTRRAPSATPLRRLVIEGVLRSARADAHNLKLPVALFEMSEQVSPRWRPLIEASLVHTLASPDSPATDFFERLES